jgi:hypothetical protein
MDKVWVVLYNNIGEGPDFHGVFATKEVAEDYVIKQEPNKEYRKYWYIEEVEIVK